MSLVLGILALGLVVGAILVWRLARRGGGDGGRELERADLQRRQEELYERLRAARAAGEGEEVAELEHQAAINLRDLEALGGPPPPAGATAATRAAADHPDATAGELQSTPVSRADGGQSVPTRTASPARSGIVGFVAGLAVAGLLMTLFYLAQRDARPRPVESQPLAEGQEHPAGMELSEAQRAELERLRADVERAPDDLSVRKRYALALLGTAQLFPAFEQAQEILAASPEDPDGLYITAFVRLEMGQTEVAVELFDRLLAGEPQHVPALVGKGLARARSGDTEAARALWTQAIQASGGDNPQIERLLAALDGQGGGTPAAGGPAPDPSGATGPVYTAVIRLGDGVEPPPSGILFVALGGDAGGPPAAVRRIAGPTFPLEVTLSARDSMLGRPLPESGTLTARLDGDGNASTRQPGDLEGTTEARQGSAVELHLSD